MGETAYSEVVSLLTPFHWYKKTESHIQKEKLEIVPELRTLCMMNGPDLVMLGIRKSGKAMLDDQECRRNINLVLVYFWKNRENYPLTPPPTFQWTDRSIYLSEVKSVWQFDIWQFPFLLGQSTFKPRVQDKKKNNKLGSIKLPPL